MAHRNNKLHLLLLAHVLVAMGLACATTYFQPPNVRLPWYAACGIEGFFLAHVAVVGFVCALGKPTIGQWLGRVAIGCLYCSAILTWYHWRLIGRSTGYSTPSSHHASLLWLIVLTPALVIVGMSAVLLVYQKRSAEIVSFDRLGVATKHHRTQFSLRDLFVGVLIAAGILALVRPTAEPRIAAHADTLPARLGEQAIDEFLNVACQIVSALLIVRACLTWTQPTIWIIAAALAAVAVGSASMFSTLLLIRDYFDLDNSWGLVESVVRTSGATNLAHVLTLVVTFLLVRWCGYRFVPRSLPATEPTAGGT